MRRLKEYGLTVDKMREIKEEELSEIIKGCSFHKVKARYIKENAEIIKTKHGEKIPNDLEKVLELKGVGMKMASLFMQTAFNQVIGIAVDTHVHRICN